MRGNKLVKGGIYKLLVVAIFCSIRASDLSGPTLETCVEHLSCFFLFVVLVVGGGRGVGSQNH